MPGQDAFGAIQEIVGLLDNDPKRIGQRSISKRCESTSST
jgi:hypothetical protein